MLKKILFLISVLIFSVTVSFPQTVRVKIIETSDVHSAVFPYDLVNDRPSNSSLAQVSAFLKEQRADTNQIVFLLDNGDILQGDPVAYYYNFEKTDTLHLIADVMNYLKYDAATVGNHDIETGHEVYDRFDKEINFPWLSANAVNTTSEQPYFKPYTTVERSGVKIAILGLITPAIPKWLPEKIWSGIRFDDMIETAKKWVKKIKETEQPDLMIGLFHSGVDFTYGGENENSYKNENASRLIAERVNGFDLIFVGHDHAGWNFKTKSPSGKEVLILGTTSNAQNVAAASYTLQYDKICMIYDKKEITGELVSMKNYSPDPDFLKRYEKNFDEVKNFVNRPIGEFTESISSRDAIFGPSKFVDLIQNIQLNLTNADVSFTAPLSFNAGIDKGTVYVKDMFDLYRFENLLYTMELSGQEIKDCLEFSCGNWFNQMKEKTDNLLKFKLDENGNIKYSERTKSPELDERFYNYDAAAGIDYTVDVTKPIGEKVTIISFSNGKPFDLNSNYRVAINSYRGNGGGGHLTRGAKIPQTELSKRILNSTEKDLRYYLMKWIENEKVVTPKLSGNWKVIPDDYWNAGKEKDYKILFK
ncbi:MAG TPA: bifunctional UDP-sugar hydrolase/5'-nucleotidase [Ignavibacteriaceae bacterium]|jgi:2',3'-cyclic-nucleotide 2'-phosphodiesterase/3'-nucleotidase|nr:MAG: Trifunctional nucleotide phosphoesterase protein YfkN precursor [Ignavibacteria bacterium ADurb.Bin266]OQY71419.1 MAG: bifunctional metallophosphatase/5'-nucleotidase [Ignavibacteriales bacterium UTCHB2]HQF41416.1 bifunctional UDP-sugar hydrolase/5'-nucleotidase [Ignavibacteriaceae bacterium]HQI40144.1 bifunctional UDP-sugar hydrolase/5'-nucleotidase [Ignavibacteriaceae bacterium]